MAQVPREQRVPKKTETLVVQHQVAAVATADGVDANVRNSEKGAIQIVGTFVGTIVFEATIDGTTFTAIAGRDVANADQSGGAAVSTATAPGMFFFNNLAGVLFVRARISVYTSGTIDIWGSFWS